MDLLLTLGIIFVVMVGIKMTKEEYSKKVEKLNKYTELYDKGIPVITDKEWDELYFEICKYEEENNFISDKSPSSTIQYSVKNNLTKVKHSHLMLSLAKTKNIEEIKAWIDNRNAVVMAKMDGLTCSLTYKNGKLVLAETRGNGKIGEDVTHNAKVISSIPKFISKTGTIVIDGEIICKYDDFESFNEYKNPRNFASGSMRLLDSRECAKRKLTFIAWDIIDNSNYTTFEDKLNWLNKYFITVPYLIKDIYNVEYLREKCQKLNYPIDGLVYRINNNKEWENLGHNDHNFKGSFAYKLYDEEYETTLKNINFTIGKSGSLTPVAYFEPVEINGTTVQNASLHNITILKELLGENPYIGQKLYVYKANMIIPQIRKAEQNFTNSDIKINIPKICPLCGSKTKIIKKYHTEVCVCTNLECKGKFANKIKHFCGKSAFDINYLSSGTIEKLISYGWITCYKDIFNLKYHKTEWLAKSGFNEVSINKIIESIEHSNCIELYKLISAICIPNVENKMSKLIANEFKTWKSFRSAIDNNYDFTQISGIGNVTAKDILEFDYSDIDNIINLIKINPVKNIENGKLKNKRFCITGKLSAKRDDIIKVIEENGGIYSAVNTNLDYLICNDSSSTSNKIKKAKELGVTIITEDEFSEMI